MCSYSISGTHGLLIVVDRNVTSDRCQAQRSAEDNISAAFASCWLRKAHYQVALHTFFLFSLEWCSEASVCGCVCETKREREGAAHRADVPNDCINVFDLRGCVKKNWIHTLATQSVFFDWGINMCYSIMSCICYERHCYDHLIRNFLK